jgi:hypothetical protein
MQRHQHKNRNLNDAYDDSVMDQLERLTSQEMEEEKKEGDSHIIRDFYDIPFHNVDITLNEMTPEVQPSLYGSVKDRRTGNSGRRTVMLHRN